MLGQGARPFSIFVRQGEYLWVDTDARPDYIRSNTGAEQPWNPDGRLYGPAAADGIWQVYLDTGGNEHLEGNWEIEARAEASAGTAVPGRVWTYRYFLRQTSGPDPEKSDLRYWMMNDSGYLYQVDLRGYRGMNSSITADPVGNVTAPGACTSAYESVDYASGRQSLFAACGGRYRVFFEEPADDLPATADLAGTEVYVAPEPLTSAELDASTLSFAPAEPGSFAGTFTATISPRFTGDYRLQIDADGDGAFAGDADVEIPLSADGRGSYVHAWDGTGPDGDALASPGRRMNARIVFATVGEMHIVQHDVEGRDGIRVVLRNGDERGDATLHWDDRGLSARDRTSVTPVRDARAGVDSSGFVHGWDFSHTCSELTEECGSWGNNRAIVDWVSSSADGSAELHGFGGAASLDITKTADRASYATVGETITYTFTVTNTGTLDLENVGVQETAFDGAGELSAVACPGNALRVGESMECSAATTVTQEDIERGAISNAAVATGNAPGEPSIASPPDEVRVPAAQAPALALVKEIANPADEAWGPRAEFGAGDALDYRFSVENTGNLALTGVTVSETAFTGSGAAPSVACPGDALAPGESMVCTGRYEAADQADADRGVIENTAVASGDAAGRPGVTSDPSTAIALAPGRPALHLVKAADRRVFAAGEEIAYSFAVTNVGSVTLTDVSVREDSFTGSGSVPALDCPTTELAPGESVLCTATYAATQEDVDRGTIDNAATASGRTPQGDAVEAPPSAVRVSAVPQPALELRKTADRTGFAAGDAIAYRFDVVNTGNTTLSGITIEERDFNGSGDLSAISCPEGAVLAPGESTSCTAAYEASQADLDAGALVNTAVAHGVDPAGGDVASLPDSVTVPAVREASLRLEKNVDRERFAAGDALGYTFTVTNTGTVTAAEVRIEELAFSGTGRLDGVVCPESEARALAPGSTLVCTAGYVASLEDQGAGAPLRNTAVAVAAPPAAGEAPIRSHPDDAVSAPMPRASVPPPGETGGPAAAGAKGPGAPRLAATGGAPGLPLAVLGAVAALAGATGVLGARARRRATDAGDRSGDASAGV
ncbi:DUF11 domain-containing protein [Leucobacter allii]|uniref:DUF11 domain-containing protein n=1 Tax=Leucobacter allii TaxID=2932247 RepID=A0ABY4FGJ8_9MICO|nr:DUF11 domain-containing protein [Leucobacter allii]UOQ55808.1 DUF11 domain-containing protein [Leucobacter allii]